MPGSAVGTVATGAGEGVMPAQVLGGPIWWLVMGLYLLTIGLAIFTLVDSLRSRRAERFSAIWEPRLLYAVPCLLYLLFVVGVWAPIVPRPVSAVPVALTPLVLALGVAYLLRVVFPKPEARTPTPIGEGTPDATDEPQQPTGETPAVE